MSCVQVFIFKAHSKPQHCSTSEPGTRQKKKIYHYRSQYFHIRSTLQFPGSCTMKQGWLSVPHPCTQLGPGENPRWNFGGSFATQAQLPAWLGWVRSVPWELCK